MVQYRESGYELAQLTLGFRICFSDGKKLVFSKAKFRQYNHKIKTE